MKTLKSSYVSSQLSRLLDEIEKTGEPVTIIRRGRPVAILSSARPRRFGQLPNLVVPDNFDDPLPTRGSAAQEGNSTP